MTDKTIEVANKISEITARLSNDLETLSALIVDASNNADARFTDIFNRQAPQLNCKLHLPYSVRSVSQHLRIRAQSVSQMLEVLANVQYIKDLELIEGHVRPWRELARQGKAVDALEHLMHYDKLSRQEAMAMIGFFSTVGK